MMKENIFTAQLTHLLYLLLLPLFFVLHGYTELYNLIPLVDSLKLTGLYLLGALFLYGISLILFRNYFKASFFVFMLMAFNFFFGPVHDAIKKALPGSFISRYSFMLPLALVFLLRYFYY